MGYLADYRREASGFDKIVKAIGALLLAGLVGWGVYWLFFRNWSEERRAERFLEAVQQQRYEDAYSYWGCNVAEPCRYYAYGEFLEDWGPESPLASVERFALGRSYTQDNGVIVEVEINGRKQPSLWIDSTTEAISFFPY